MDLSGIEELSVDECWELLGDASLRQVGRLAIASGEEVLILPVGFGVDDHGIVLRTHVGIIATHADTGRPVTFEADAGHPAEGSGWSVVVVGTAEVVTDMASVSRMRQRPPFGWGGKHVWVRIRPTKITGRRVVWPRALSERARNRAQETPCAPDRSRDDRQ